MADFVKVYWSKGINFLHSIIFILTGIYFIMILWLPYFFTRMGHHATFISIAYPFAYILSGFIFQPIQMAFRKFTGQLFLVVLTLNIILTFFLIRLGDDSDEIPKYIPDTWVLYAFFWVHGLHSNSGLEQSGKQYPIDITSVFIKWEFSPNISNIRNLHNRSPHVKGSSQHIQSLWSYNWLMSSFTHCSNDEVSGFIFLANLKSTIRSE